MTVLIAGGGTGGHVFPMIAVGDAVLALEPSARVVYVGTERGIEARVMRERGDDIRMMDIAPLRGGGVRGFVKGVSRAAASIPGGRKLVQSIAPDVVLSIGGYAAGPVSLAARTLGVPVAILEPNSVLGLANRLLAPIAVRAYVAFPETERYFRPSTIVKAGVPLRRAFAPADYAPIEGPLSILILGGSQGAKALNESVPDALAIAAKAGVELRVVHQAGRDRDADVRARYEAAGLASRATVTPFLDDVASALAAADVVIARSGASSCAEMCAVGRPGILVPYPFAADDHQRRNAESLERAGAAVCLVQSEATPPTIAAEVARLAKDPSLRARMAKAARELGKPDAARSIAKDLIDLAASRARKEAS